MTAVREESGVVLLERAAARLRELADEATPGPRQYADHYGQDDVPDEVQVLAGTAIETRGASYTSTDMMLETSTHHLSPDEVRQVMADARFIAAWSPDLARGVADLLDLIAGRWREWDPPAAVVAQWKQAQGVLAIAQHVLGEAPS